MAEVNEGDWRATVQERYHEHVLMAWIAVCYSDPQINPPLPNLVFGDLSKIHPDDVRELLAPDIPLNHFFLFEVTAHTIRLATNKFEFLVSTWLACCYLGMPTSWGSVQNLAWRHSVSETSTDPLWNLQVLPNCFAIAKEVQMLLEGPLTIKVDDRRRRPLAIKEDPCENPEAADQKALVPENPSMPAVLPVPVGIPPALQCVFLILTLGVAIFLSFATGHLGFMGLSVALIANLAVSTALLQPPSATAAQALPPPAEDMTLAVERVLKNEPTTFSALLAITHIQEPQLALILQTLVRQGKIAEDFDTMSDMWVYSVTQVSDLEDLGTRCKRLGIPS